MTAPVACSCTDAREAHYLWSGCSQPGCGCRYRYVPAGSDAARQAAMTRIRQTIAETRRRRQASN